MNSRQIYQVLSRNVKHFNNVYSIDTLPSVFSLPAIFIVNFDPSHLPGSHWVAIYISDTGYGEYFDSYGMRPIKSNLVHFLRLHSKHWTYNKRRLQGVISHVCGQYCCLYALYRGSGISMETFTDQFSKNNFCFNDQLIVSLYRKYFDKCHACRKFKYNQTCIPQLDIIERHIQYYRQEKV